MLYIRTICPLCYLSLNYLRQRSNALCRISDIPHLNIRCRHSEDQTCIITVFYRYDIVGMTPQWHNLLPSHQIPYFTSTIFWSSEEEIISRIHTEHSFCVPFSYVNTLQWRSSDSFWSRKWVDYAPSGGSTVYLRQRGITFIRLILLNGCVSLRNSKTVKNIQFITGPAWWGRRRWKTSLWGSRIWVFLFLGLWFFCFFICFSPGYRGRLW